MLNKVVSTLQRTARDAGLVTLRFNYRGVGASAGNHDMGTGEVDDAQAVAQWLREKYPQLPLTLFGFPSVASSPPAWVGVWKPRVSRSSICSWWPRR